MNPTANGDAERRTSPVTAIVAFSFAQHEPSLEPSLCNRALAAEVLRLKTSYPDATVIAQWEVARGLDQLGEPSDFSIDPTTDGSYLSSEKVWQAAVQRLDGTGTTQIIVVAQPFLHLAACRHLVRRSGFAVRKERVRNIGFDNSPANTQWQTRGPARLLLYTILQLARRALASLRRNGVEHVHPRIEP